jgi:hypothetical protein
MTDFETYLSAIDADNLNEIFNLYQAIECVSEFEPFNCIKNGDLYNVTCPHVNEPLELTEKSRIYFLKYLDEKYAGEDWDIESRLGFEEAMANDNT